MCFRVPSKGLRKDTCWLGTDGGWGMGGWGFPSRGVSDTVVQKKRQQNRADGQGGMGVWGFPTIKY